MRIVVQNMKTGIVSVEEVPVPLLRPGCVLVRNKSSLISAGTEGGTVRLGKMSILGKARARPEQVKKVLKALRTEGVVATANAVMRTLDSPVTLGYSCAGIVEKVSEDVADLTIGTPVACAGAGMAVHADSVVIPRNLCVPIPPGVSFQDAAFTTVGSIAMHSVRTAEVQLGENVVVIGLGLVGLLVAATLKAGGCNVFGIDIDDQRVQWAQEKGICPACVRRSENIVDRILDFSGGFGADAVMITAATPDNDPIVLAGEICRYKGRVVVVGRTVMNAPRETYLFKELALSTSYAYGPGTEDPGYEVQGYDYPVGYVRWTVNRNMQCFLDLLKETRIDLSPLLTHTFSVENAPQAFDLVTTAHSGAVGVVLEYGERERGAEIPRGRIPSVRALPKSALGRPHVGIIGAGSFATNTMVPLLAKRKDVVLRAIASANGVRAAALARRYKIEAATSDADELIHREDIDCIFLFTRHGTHASFTERALLAGKHVFVEKPLALTRESLEAVVSAREKSGKVLMVGFNRCFSPLAKRQRDFFSSRIQPMMIEFRGNVGYRPREHWLHDPREGGGIILGEACHYIDFCRWIVDSPIVEADAACVGESSTKTIPEDNVSIALRFHDGSLASILYVSEGAGGYGRERCEAHAEGKSALWEDFKQVKLVSGLGFPRTYRSGFFRRKGYREELDAFFDALRVGAERGEWLARQIDSSSAAIEAARKIL